MLNWLDNLFHRARGVIGGAVSDAIHWAVRGLAAVVFAVFGAVKKAWAVTAGAMADLHKALDVFGASVVRWAAWLWRVEIPRILRWAQHELARLAADLARLRDWAIVQLARLTLWVTHQITAVYQWVLRDVYDPLSRAIARTYQDLLKWGYYSYQYITHPERLAELLIMPLVVTFEKYAWQIARQLGTFTLALITANLPKVLALAEDIITAVF